MVKKSCPAGSKWDGLLQKCSPLRTGRRVTTPLRLHTPTEPFITPLVLLTNTPPTDQTLAVVSPALWVVVLLATLGSVLALALWLVIYRRHTSQPTVEEPAEQPLRKTEPVHCPLPSEASAQGQQHLPTPHPTAPWWQGDTHGTHIGHDGGNWGGGLKGSTVRQETVPLPATELGGTALVTTKTL